MAKIKIDLRFVDIGYERMMLEQYVALVDAHLEDLKSKEAARIEAATDPEDEADIQLMFHLKDRLEEGVTTRFLVASVIVAVWALYEAAVDEIAEYAQKRRGLSLKLSSVRGAFVDRARKYFDEVLKFPLHHVGADWDRLAALERLRHALAHGNGDLRHVQGDKLKPFAKWCSSTQGISVVAGRYVVIQPTFATDSVAFLKTLLDDLTNRTRLEFR
jgi:hypothetical protein